MPRNKKTAATPRLSERANTAGYQGFELIFYGQMSLVREADAFLATVGYGRAHFRTMYMIANHPGITGNELLGRLKITNQSLSRVLKQLLLDGIVRQESGVDDRRQRRHTLTPEGAALHRKASELQLAALHKAYEAAGHVAVDGFLRVLQHLVPPEDKSFLTYPISDE